MLRNAAVYDRKDTGSTLFMDLTKKIYTTPVPYQMRLKRGKGYNLMIK
jgi:hypothetical protein